MNSRSNPLSITTPPKVNYLNNRDILKEIHLSKNSYCSFLDPKLDHQYDIILPSVSKINQRTVAEARRNRAARLTRETGEPVKEKNIEITDLVFRVMTWEHIPLAPKKPPRKSKKKNLAEIIDFADNIFESEEEVVDAEEPVLDPTHVRVNFPPFFHYRITDRRVPYLVGKSHWRGDLDTGHYSREHGSMTRRLAEMFIKLCERYATRSNWRGYTYNEEMRGQALLQLSQIGLQFDESKSQNPFAYYTAAITNSFTRILNIEKKNQNIRDDILEMHGLNPSWTRQYANSERSQHTGLSDQSGTRADD
jgi:hypothetical protein